MSSLRQGLTASCGCKRAENTRKLNLSHGMGATPEYFAWYNAIARCTDSENEAFAGYGGRGIMVCERWLHSFENFFADMGKRPSREHSIDRMDNDGNYEPTNCRWATAQQQADNRRPRAA